MISFAIHVAISVDMYVAVSVANSVALYVATSGAISVANHAPIYANIAVAISFRRFDLSPQARDYSLENFRSRCFT